MSVRLANQSQNRSFQSLKHCPEHVPIYYKQTCYIVVENIVLLIKRHVEVIVSYYLHRVFITRQLL